MMSSGRSAAQTPAATASCPMQACTPLPMSPDRASSTARSSKRRMSRMVRYRATGSGRAGSAITGASLDGGEDAVPEAVPRGERKVNRARTLLPFLLVVAAEVGEHLHGHRGVLFAVHLDVPREVVHEGVQLALAPLLH